MVLTLAGVLIGGIISGALPEALDAVFHAHPLFIGICFLLYGVHLAVHGLALCSYLKQAGYHLRFRDAVVSALTSIYYSCITPGSAGGQPMQVLYLARCGIPAGAATGAIAVFTVSWHMMRIVLFLLFALPCASFIASSLGPSLPFLGAAGSLLLRRSEESAQ